MIYYRKGLRNQLFQISADFLVANQFRTTFPLRTVQNNGPQSPILMSLAVGQIIANSTYGFLVAYTSKRSKFVCYPAWDRNNYVLVTGIPSKWLQIEKSWS